MKPSSNTPGPDRKPDGPLLVSDQGVANLLAISRRTVWKLSAVGTLPRPLRIGRASRWRFVDIAAYVDGLADAGEP